MLLVEVKEMPTGKWDLLTTINVYAFKDLAEFKRFKDEKTHPLVKEWFGENYKEQYMSLTYVCREYTEENIENAKQILEDYLEFFKHRDSRF